MPPKRVKKATSSTVTHRAAKNSTTILDYDIDSAYEANDVVEKSNNSENPTPEDDGLHAKNGVFSYYMTLLDLNINTRHVFQIFALLFIINLLYLAFKESSKSLDPLLTSGCVLLAALLQALAVLNSRFRQFESGKTETAPTLLDFNYVYTVTFPILAVLLKAPENVSLIACCIVQLGYMNVFVRVLISYVILIQFGSDLTFTGQILTIPVSTCFFYELINKFVSDNIPIYEKSFLSILITSLSYFVNFNESNITLVVFKNLFLSFIVGLVFSSPLIEFYKSQNEKSLKYSLLTIAYLIFFAAGLIISDKLLLDTLKKFPLNWLIDFINESSTRLSIFKTWFLSAAILLPLIFITFNKLNVNLSLKRKIWHFVAFAFLIKPMVIEPELTSIALFGIFGILILVEIIRANELPPFGTPIKNLFEKYEDNKDSQGKFILSYIYLIIGISLPFWINNIDNRKQSSYIGLIALGFGDSTASIIGNKFGVSKWPNSEKSIEGTIAMAVGILLGYVILDYIYVGDEPLFVLNWTNRFLCAVLCSIFEGIVDINDNLFVPVYGFIIEELLTYFN